MKGVEVMQDVNVIARYLVKSYEEYTQSNFEPSELKLQKLMYYVQKHSYALLGKKAFEGVFEGWTHGPVLRELRFFLEDGYTPLTATEENAISEDIKYVVGNVLSYYAEYEAWKLRNLSHEEYSWQQSRKGLHPDEPGKVPITDDDIIVDAQRLRLYDHEYDMYIDEFEDFEQEVM